MNRRRRRRDLYTSEHVRPGVYVLDGDEGDMDAVVIGGPFPTEPAARAFAVGVPGAAGSILSLALVVEAPHG